MTPKKTWSQRKASASGQRFGVEQAGISASASTRPAASVRLQIFEQLAHVHSPVWRDCADCYACRPSRSQAFVRQGEDIAAEAARFLAIASFNREDDAMAFQLPELPFAKDALAPHMSAETLEFHHGKHHKAYVDKTNGLIGETKALIGASLVEVVRPRPRRRARPSCSTTARSCGTTASSGNAWRPPRGRSRRASCSR